MPFSPNAIQAIHDDALATCVQGEFMGKPFNIYGHRGEPIFRLGDIGEMLGYHKHSMAKTLSWIPAGEKLVRPADVSGQRRNVWFVTERGMDVMLTNSHKPMAKLFKGKLLAIKDAWAKEGGVIAADGTVFTALMRITSEMAAMNVKFDQLQQRTALQLQGATQQVQAAEAKAQAAQTRADQVVQAAESILHEHKPGLEFLERTRATPVKTYTPTEMGAVYGISAKAVNKLLEEFEMQWWVGDQWVGKGKYIKSDYSFVKEITHDRDGKLIVDDDGFPNPQYQTRWTNLARIEFDRRMIEKGMIPISMRQTVKA